MICFDSMNDFDNLIQEFKKLKLSIVEFEQQVAEKISDINSKVHEYSNLLGEKYCQPQCDDFDADDDFEEDLEQEKYILSSINVKKVRNFCWHRCLPVNTTKTTHYGNFVDLLLTFSPIVIRIPVSVAPIVAYHDKFVRASNIPPTGNYLYGNVCGVPVIVDNKLDDTLLMECGNEEFIVVTIKN